MSHYDLLWKAAVEEMPEDGLKSILGDHAQQIDFSRRPEFMDKELSVIIQSNRKKLEANQLVDFLVKVWLLDGREQWILIHIEVQSQPDAKFAERMYQYYIRIKQKFKCDVTSVAVLADGNQNFRPSRHSESCLGTHLRETESITVRFDAATLPSHFPYFCLNSDAIRTKIDLFETKLASLKSDTY
jgi:Putative transposase, YhgA-like